MPQSSVSVRIIEVDVSEIIPLRHQVLLANLPKKRAKDWDGDYAFGTHHFAAFLPDRIKGDDWGKPVGCATFILHEGWRAGWAYQLRGMAIDPKYQGQGIGRRLLEQSEMELPRDEIRTFWCNARKLAVAFYEKLGWTRESLEFEENGAHFLMVKQLESPTTSPWFQSTRLGRRCDHNTRTHCDQCDSQGYCAGHTGCGTFQGFFHH